MSNILITGASGFLGKHILKSLSERGDYVVGICHSESNTKKLERIIENNNLKNISLENLNIVYDKASLKNIIKKRNIDFVIHAAALKHVGICEKNTISAVKTNLLGSINVLEAAIECNVKNVIAISTDKAKDPVCSYGMTKNLMEKIYIDAGFGVFRGVNFLFSSQSVLEVWDENRKNNLPILVNKSAIRYFSPISDIVNVIIDSIKKKEIFSVESCLEITVDQLHDAFCTYHNYWNVKEYKPLSIEKVIESIPLENIKIVIPNNHDILNLLRSHYNSGV